MPTSTVNSWESPVAYRYFWKCRAIQDVHMDPQLMKQVTTVSNGPEHRQKPVDLIGNMTAQPQQSKTVVTNCYHGPFLIQDDAVDYSCYPNPYPHDIRVWGWSVVGAGGQIIEPGAVPQDRDTDLELRLAIKKESINLGTALAEYRQSARMFGSAARKVVETWRFFKGKRNRKVLTPCMIPSSYLVYTYGVAPLIGDLYNSVEELALRLGFPLRKRYFAASQGLAKASQTTTDSGMEKKIDARMSSSKRVTAYVEFDVENASRFTAGNILEVGWEVIPYSFVVDWVFSVGDYLSSIDALRAVSNMNVSTVTKVKYNHNVKLKYTNAHGTTYSNHNGAYIFESHKRDVSHTIPLPSLPSYKPSRSYKTIVNGLMLLWQTFANGNGNCKPKYTPKW